MYSPNDDRLLCPTLNLNPPSTPSTLYSSTIAFFTSIPWTSALLSAPDTIPYIPCCRNPLDALKDQFFGVTLANPRTVPHMLCLFHASPTTARDVRRPVMKTVTLVALGDGTSGYAGVVHGGVTAALMDESMGALFELNTTLGKDAPGFKGFNVTAGLDITYVRPIKTNSVVCVTSTVEEMSGRKTRIYCEVTDGEDNVLAKCSSRWAALRGKL